MTFVMIFNSCKSSFQSLGSTPGRSCVTQECKSASRDSCVRGENLFLDPSLHIFKWSSKCLGYNCGNRVPCNNIFIRNCKGNKGVPFAPHLWKHNCSTAELLVEIRCSILCCSTSLLSLQTWMCHFVVVRFDCRR